MAVPCGTDANKLPRAAGHLSNQGQANDRDREVADDPIAVEPHIRTRRAGAIGGKAGVPKPADEVVVAEDGDPACARGEPFEPRHLPCRRSVSGSLGRSSQGGDNLARLVELLQQRVEEVRRHDGLIGEPAVGRLPRHAVHLADLCPRHACGLRIEEHLALERLDTRRERMDGADAVTRVRRVQ